MKVRTGAKLNFELETGAHAPINNENNPYDGATQNNFASMKEAMNLQQYQPDDSLPAQMDNSSGKDSQTNENQRYIVHKVDYNDTMEGLALQYNVSAREIRIFNGLSSNEIYYLKEIKIPHPDLQNLHMSNLEVDVEELRRKQKLKTLKECMDPKDMKAAQFYLDENEWDVNAALENYNKDVEFERRFKKLQLERANNYRKNVYPLEELRIKKNK